MSVNLVVKRNPVILVVDDSKYMRYTLCNFLKNWGYDVIEAADGIQALAIFEKSRPDIVLMDFIMSKMDGVTACTQLQKLPGGNNVPIIMITSLDDEKSVDRAFEAGATDYINKPIHWPVLRQRIKRLLRARYTEISLNQSEAFARSIIDNALDGIITVDKQGIIQSFNVASEHIFGYTSSEVIGKNIKLLIPKLACNECNDVENNKDNKTVGASIEMKGRRKDNSTLPIELTISKFYLEAICLFTIILRDITEKHRYEEMIRYQAFHDPLTGMPNRLLLKERFNLELAHAKQNDYKLCIMYLDLDRFKLVNDTLGHDTGDQLLKIVAKRLINCVRADDTVARMGGDEFTLLLTRITQEESVGNYAHRILDAIRQPVIIGEHELYLTGSIGIAIYPDDGENPESLLTNADIAMYRAKEKGKNNFQLYTASMNEKALERLAMENSLRRALEYEEFLVYYQPKVDGNNEKVIGMEALVRWQHPKWGMLPPDKFIALAEDTGLIIPIGEWVLQTACTQTKEWHNSGFFPLTVAVNLSARQFQLQDLTKMVSEALKETGLEAQYLELEITESIAMENVEYTLKMMHELKEMGVQFAIDDFGTGYSSLSYLKQFAINKLKIDRSFISEINGEQDKGVIASTVLALGKSLKLGVVAEGVETEEQLNFFKQTPCDEMQGYIFGRPMAPKDFENYYKKRSNNL